MEELFWLLGVFGPAFGRKGAGGLADIGLGGGVFGRLGEVGLLIGVLTACLLVIEGFVEVWIEGLEELLFASCVECVLAGAEGLVGLLGEVFVN